MVMPVLCHPRLPVIMAKVQAAPTAPTPPAVGALEQEGLAKTLCSHGWDRITSLPSGGTPLG